MTKQEELFHTIASGLVGTHEGKMFGALCIKATNGKAGVMFRKDGMIFKLSGKDQEYALSLEGAEMFDPMGGRPMNGWVYVPDTHSMQWSGFAEIAK